MSVPTSPLLAQAASTTSSGFADGLGRRVLAFDREEGMMLERLVLRPELAAFETMLRDRVERLAALEDERLARPRTIERDADGALTVVSEFVPGSRLSDLLEVSGERGAMPGVDAALGYLLDVLPALCGLHAGAGFAHGSITPSRTVLTPAGQIVLLDGIYGGALSRLRYSRARLWREFGVAAAATAGAPRLDADADIAQATLSAVMLVLGRPLRGTEYPDGLQALADEVVEIAQIRGSVDFASGFQELLSRALPLPIRKPYATVDDALFDVRQLAAELGPHLCRRALVEFIEQMESPAHQGAGTSDAVADEIENYGLSETEVESFDEDQNLDAGVDAEINLDVLEDESHYDLHEAVEIEPHEAHLAPHALPAEDEARSAQADAEEFDWVAAATHAAHERADAIAAPPQPEAVEAVALSASAGESDAKGTDTAVSVAAPEVAAEADVPSVRSRRAKRALRSARARKDKLRSVSVADEPTLGQSAAPVKPAPVEPVPVSTAAVATPVAIPAPIAPVAVPTPVVAAPSPASPPVPPPVPVAAVSNSWLVPPDRAAAFEPPVPEPPRDPAPRIVPAEAPRIPVYTQPPLPPPAAPEPVFSRTVAVVAPSYPAAPAWTPPPLPLSAPAPPQSGPVTFKMRDLPRPRAPRQPEPPPDIYSSAPAIPVEPPSAFPWKLAAAAGVIMIVAIVGGHVYLPARGAGDEPPAPVRPATTAAPARTTVPAAAAGAATTGRLEIETQPAGARILIDGRPAGESPVALDGIPAGRHTVTLVTSTGTVKRTIRVEAGRTAKLDVPIFSGWVGIFAPFVVEVSEGGRVIGTTDEPRLMLSPGKHDLRLTNRELGYSSAQSVDIEPGEVKSISIDPRGVVNLNALPWAEVWIDGKKAGDTPIANLQLPLGMRDVIFRHPQFGDRRVTITVKGNAPAAASVDMTKPGP